MKRGATFSPDRSMRFELTRFFLNELAAVQHGIVNLIGLNPSDAGETRDDMTSRKGVGFAKRWGYDGMVLTNIVPIVATDPYDLPCWAGRFHDNEEYLKGWIEKADLIVCAWGAVPTRVMATIGALEHIHIVKQIADEAGKKLHCIGLTKAGWPLHPSRTAYTEFPLSFEQGKL